MLGLNRLRPWAVFLTPVLIALGLGSLLRSTWLPEALDGALRSHYYEIARPSGGQQDVVLIAVDDRAVARWGPPPWSWGTVEPVLDAVLAGAPKAVAFVDRQRLVADEPRLSEAARKAADEGRFALDFASEIRTAHLPVSVLDVSPDQWQALDGSFGPAYVQAFGERELPIRYVNPPEGLPVVPFNVAADGDLAPQTFTDKLVLIAVTATSHADRLPTPVGALTKAEIVAHALSGLAQGKPPVSPPEHLRTSVLLLVLVLVRLLAARPSPRTALALTAAAMLSLFVGDYLLFTHGFVHWGASTAAFASAVVVVATFYIRTRESSSAVEALCHGAAAAALLGPSRPDVRLEHGEDEWNTLLELGLLHFGKACPTLLAELTRESWQLQFRAGQGIDTGSVIERRRDIRRAPFRDILLTHRVRQLPSIVGDENTWTYAVPLVHASRIVGVWFLEWAKDEPLGVADEQRLQQIGAAMGARIARSRAHRDDERAVCDASSLALPAQVEVVARSLNNASRDHQNMVRLFERLPIGFLVADMWGHIVHVNALMHQRLVDDFPGGIPNDDLRAVLARATGGTLEQAQDLMRSAVHSNVDIHFTARLDIDGALNERPTFILTRVDLGEEASEDLDTRHLLLIARPDFDDAANRMFRSA